MNRVDKHSIYLGLPTFIGRSKKTVFQAVVDRMGKNLKRLKEQLISTTGKLILIKSVAQAIPTYIMCYLLLP